MRARSHSLVIRGNNDTYFQLCSITSDTRRRGPRDFDESGNGLSRVRSGDGRELNNTRVKATYARRWISRKLAPLANRSSRCSAKNISRDHPTNFIHVSGLTRGIGSIASDTTVIHQSDLLEQNVSCERHCAGMRRLAFQER